MTAKFQIAILILLNVVLSQAQQKDKHCATMEMDSLNRARFPQRGRLEDFEDVLQTKIKELKSQNKGGRTMAGVVSIPIIVHVVHNGEAVGTGANISQAQVQSQIAVLNEDFRRLAGTPGGASTNPLAADIEIEFCLSPVGPNGEVLAEPGIHRYNGNRADWSRDQIENQLKPTTIWNPNLFYNIWTVKFASVDASLIGYAQFPDQSGLSGLNVSGGPASTDGVVIRFQSFGRYDNGNFPVMASAAPYNKGRTLSHETGHWLGLRHIWGDGPCASDFVDDTPSAAGPSSGCPIGRVSCDVQNMVQNYMDYSDDACMNIFTEGQKTRMQAVIQISPRRKSLVEGNLCSPIVADVPTTNFVVANTDCILLGSTVDFTDLSTNFPTEWHWTFEGGDPAISSERNPRIKYQTAGTYFVSLWSKNSIGISDTLKIEGLITVTNEGICRDFNNFKPSYTPSFIKLSNYGSYSGYLTGTNSTESTGLSEFFENNCGYLYISGLNIKFSKIFFTEETSTVNFVVWNARGAQYAPGSVIERKKVLFKQIEDDIANNRPTSIVFDRETPVFGKPFQVGIELENNGDTLVIQSSSDGEAVDATSWIKNKNGIWEKFSIAFGTNIAMNIQPVVGMNPSVQVSSSSTIIFPGQQVTLNGRGASIFVWNASNGSITNFTGPQLVVNPTETTTYITSGSGLELCSTEASTTIFVSSTITEVVESQSISGLTLFPNPGKKSFKINFSDPATGTVAIQILSAQGQIIKQIQKEKVNTDFSEPIELEAVKAGLYFVQISLGGKQVMRKWISIP